MSIAVEYRVEIDGEIVLSGKCVGRRVAVREVEREVIQTFVHNGLCIDRNGKVGNYVCIETDIRQVEHCACKNVAELEVERHSGIKLIIHTGPQALDSNLILGIGNFCLEGSRDGASQGIQVNGRIFRIDLSAYDD